MFDFLFDPSLEKNNDYYIFKGMNYYLLFMDFQNAYGTITMPKTILEKINRYSFRVHKFFLLEFHYTLVKIINQRKLKTPLDKLLRIQHLVETETWIEQTINPEKIDWFDKIKGKFHFKPFDLQEMFLRTYKTITNAYHLKGLLLDGKVGSGKTLNLLMWSAMLNDLPTIVICPDATVNSVWVAEIEKHFIKKQKVWTTLSELPLEPGYDFYIIHYSALTSQWGPMLTDFIKLLKKLHKSPLKLGIDESHNFNDEKSLRSQFVTMWSDLEFFSDTLCLSGTPLKAQGRETYTLFTLIDTFFDKKARKVFFDLYGKSRDNLNELMNHRIGRGKFTIPEVNGIGETPPLEIIPIEIPNGERYTLKNVRSEMMNYIEERIKFYALHIQEYNDFFWNVVHEYGESVKNDKKQHANYMKYVVIIQRFKKEGFRTFDKQDIEDNLFCKQMEEFIMEGLNRDDKRYFKNILSAVKYLGLKVRGEALGNVLGKMRAEAATDLIRNANLPSLIKSVKKKTLIFSSYIETIIFCEDYLKGKGFKPVSIYGETNHDRDAILGYLENDPKVNPGIANFKSLKEGVPCLWANQIIMIDSPFRDYIVTQVLARVWREGQDSMCYFWLLDLDTGNELNIASRSIDIMKWSGEQVDQLISKAAGYSGMDDLKGVTGNEALDMEMWQEEETIYMKKHAQLLNIF